MNEQKGASASTVPACPKKVTFSHLPQASPRPLHATDYTGQRRGKMTAIAWYRPDSSGKGTLWICRCDCGLYELRRPGTWQARPYPDDLCTVCLRAKGPNARETAQARLQLWLDGLRGLGLDDGEISRIRAPGADIETRGKSAAQIREQLARRQP